MTIVNLVMSPPPEMITSWTYFRKTSDEHRYEPDSNSQLGCPQCSTLTTVLYECLFLDEEDPDCL